MSRCMWSEKVLAERCVRGFEFWSERIIIRDLTTSTRLFCMTRAMGVLSTRPYPFGVYFISVGNIAAQTTNDTHTECSCWKVLPFTQNTIYRKLAIWKANMRAILKIHQSFFVRVWDSRNSRRRWRQQQHQERTLIKTVSFSFVSWKKNIFDFGTLALIAMWFMCDIFHACLGVPIQLVATAALANLSKYSLRIIQRESQFVFFLPE